MKAQRKVAARRKVVRRTARRPAPLSLSARVERLEKELLFKIPVPQTASIPGTLVPPRIGQAWEGQGGVYAGIVRGTDGAPDYHLVVGPEVDPGSFADVNKRCTEVEVDGHTDFDGLLRKEQSVAFGNVPELFEKAWYWSKEQHASSCSYAWVQYFYDGDQGYWGKDDTRRGRAVRRLTIS